MRHTRRSRPSKASWMADFQTLAVAEGLFQPGRVCWDTAHFFFNQGIEPTAAVEQMVCNRKGDTL